MSYTPIIYDWRQSVAPINQIVRAGGQAIEGGLTLGGAYVENPEPGGRAELVMEFATMVEDQANRDASWTVSRILSGSLMRVRLWRTVQLVSEEDLTVTDEGLTWANGDPWSNDEFWRADPWVPVATGASQGAVTVELDFSPIGQALQIGHLIGFHEDGYDFTHVVMDIEYDESDVATVTVSPPLRRDVTTDSLCHLRPTMIVTCRNAREVMTNFTSGRHIQLNAARFVEAML